MEKRSQRVVDFSQERRDLVSRLENPYLRDISIRYSAGVNKGSSTMYSDSTGYINWTQKK